MIETLATIVSGAALYGAYRLLVTMPVKKEMDNERHLAEAEDYKELFNTDNERNYKL